MNSSLIFYSIINFFLFYIIAKISYRFNFLDIPNKRKIHSKSTAFTGGIAISISWLISLEIFELFNYTNKNLNLILSMAFLAATARSLYVVVSAESLAALPNAL